MGCTRTEKTKYEELHLPEWFWKFDKFRGKRVTIERLRCGLWRRLGWWCAKYTKLLVPTRGLQLYACEMVRGSFTCGQNIPQVSILTNGATLRSCAALITTYRCLATTRTGTKARWDHFGRRVACLKCHNTRSHDNETSETHYNRPDVREIVEMEALQVILDSDGRIATQFGVCGKMIRIVTCGKNKSICIMNCNQSVGYAWAPAIHLS